MKGVSISRACSKFNRSRQSYYKFLMRKEKMSMDQEKLHKLVLPIRHLMPRLGGRKLYFMIQDSIAQAAIKIGRDRFFDWLRAHDLLIYPKRRYVHTTNSFHRFWVHDNLCHDLLVAGPNRLWVSDITYLRTKEGNCFLALITDAWSRKIVGYDVSDSLEFGGCMRAMQMALQTAGEIGELVHHSDRGVQYCSIPYTDLLKQKGVRISMAAKGNCYENALAERVNGILKDEFNLDEIFNTKEQAFKTVHQSIYIYNKHRPHWALNLKTPQVCHAA